MLGVRNSLFRCDHTRRGRAAISLPFYRKAARALSKYNWICTAGIFIASAVYLDGALFWLDCVLLRPPRNDISALQCWGTWSDVRCSRDISLIILLGRFYDTDMQFQCKCVDSKIHSDKFKALSICMEYFNQCLCSMCFNLENCEDGVIVRRNRKTKLN